MALELMEHFDRVNDFVSVSIQLASPEDIRSWSYGEVKKPETINYRTYRAEKDGLFCERIFGPERDWECFCGKYKGMKHKGIICDRCGVKVTHSRERRKRMGHINLAAPVVHLWFFKALPSRLGALLGIKTSHLERVVYFQEHVVIDPGPAAADGLEEGQLLSEEQYREYKARHGDAFQAGMGAEAVRELLQKLELESLSKQLRQELIDTKSKQRKKELINRLRTVEAVRLSGNRPDWMVMEVIPVIPPDLRPLVLLESGNFATSDLNDLYRRVINRNNRLKKLLELHAPEVIIRNEKRMLQQAVDALFDNERCSRPVLDSGNRPLKSLTDMIKGKQGRFRENLLGKRVDYSARSVIVVGPELKMDQCGLPKKIALELFQPFIIRRLKELGYVDTFKSARRMLERKDEEVWDILDEVIRRHPVLLNRAPTLHRMGIQAFEPVLIEGNAIEIHPLVCESFNADFDGDQMAVHLPLSIEAQTEASVLMLSSNNIFSPADGFPIICPSLDIVLGCYYLTCLSGEVEGSAPKDRRREPKAFRNEGEVLMALAHKKISLHEKILLRLSNPDRDIVTEEEVTQPERGRITTTAGRVVFNDIVPRELPFYNLTQDKKKINAIITECYQKLGRKTTVALLDAVKDLGFHHATLAGISFAVDDLKMPPGKEQILRRTQRLVDRVRKNYLDGSITDSERHNQVIEAWTSARDEVADALMAELRRDEVELVGGDRVTAMNPIYLMHASGAKGTAMQIRQLAGMRGLMTKPSGDIIETPIKSNFREGLPVLEYFSSTHGGRKGLADTALKTAESGYLTRKLVDASQNVVITEQDCGTINGTTKTLVYKGDKVEVSLSRAITGRTAQETVVDRKTAETLVREGGLIDSTIAQKIEALGYDSLRVRSPIACEAPHGICAKCYGMDLSTGALAEEGLAVGIIAAESIGEPGTQLTMRTFHIGGTAQRTVEASALKSPGDGVIRYSNLQFVVNEEGQTVVLNPNGSLILCDSDDNEIKRFNLLIGAVLEVKEGAKVKTGTLLASWDPHMVPILAEHGGLVEFEDIIEDQTMREEVDASGFKRKVIVEHKGDLHPQIIVKDDSGEILGVHAIPERAHIEVEEGGHVRAGTLLAKTPKEIRRSEDITAGLPRVTELFEARRPKDPAIISEISGTVELGERKRGKQTVIVRSESGVEREHLVPFGKHLLVSKGDQVRAGERLTDGPLVPHDILRINGEEALQQYLLSEIQAVYRSQGEMIDDKHVAIVIRQMLSKVLVGDDVGDTSFLPGSTVDKFQYRQENERVVGEDGQPATAETLLLGVTKAALQSESFIAAASFQETTKVLTGAALAGRVDTLVGLKENVILGRMIPAGTGFGKHRWLTIKKALAEEPIGQLEETEA